MTLYKQLPNYSCRNQAPCGEAAAAGVKGARPKQQGNRVKEVCDKPLARTQRRHHRRERARDWDASRTRDPLLLDLVGMARRPAGTDGAPSLGVTVTVHSIVAQSAFSEALARNVDE